MQNMLYPTNHNLNDFEWKTLFSSIIVDNPTVLELKGLKDDVTSVPTVLISKSGNKKNFFFTSQFVLQSKIEVSSMKIKLLERIKIQQNIVDNNQIDTLFLENQIYRELKFILGFSEWDYTSNLTKSIMKHLNKELITSSMLYTILYNLEKIFLSDFNINTPINIDNITKNLDNTCC